ncbi:MAG: thioredoxin family protein [Alistipes sp.]|nr:thioredoxin family protein [Alistipes sp.]
MKFFIRIALLASMLVSLLSAHAQTQTVAWESSVKELGGSSYEIQFKGKILPGWHTYDLHSDVSSTLVEFEEPAGLVLDGEPYEVNASQREYDDIFEVEIGTYFDEIVLGQKVTLEGEGGVLKGNINWRACEENNCNSPEDWEFEVVIGNPDAAPAVVEAADEVEPERENGGKSIWSLIIEAIIWGFAALVTPCVFPMIPMTVSFFMKGSGSPAAGRFKAAMYGFFIVMLYTLPIAAIILITRLVGGDAVTADIFNWLATHWLPNLIFFVVFMVFAASFFGAFEITLPSWMVNKSDQNADKGGLVGIFFMALTLVLVSFSCTGPIVGSVLIKSTAGEFWEPIVTMLAFSMAFALPFTVFAFFPSLLKNLPKSGGWLGSVKVVLGFIEVALGFKFLSMADQTYHWGLLDREIYLAIWIVVFTLLGLYLLGKLRFAHDDELKHVTVTRLALSIVSLSFAVYMVPGMFGAPLKGLSGYLPPLHTQDFVINPDAVAAAPVAGNTAAAEKIKYADILHWPYELNGYFDMAQAEEVAKAAGKPLFVDITGISCVNCREMEARVWSDPRVQQILREEYVLVALYTDDKTKVEKSEWITTEGGKVLKDIGRINSYIAQTRFGVNGQPNYLLLDNEGNQLVPMRAYNLDVDAYIDFLKRGVEEYKKLK